MNGTAVVVAFWALAVLTLGSALMVALVRDLIHAVLFLILSFVGIAGLYITLSADFVAVVQILIYAGAISVLMLFAILLTPRASRDNSPVSFAAPLSVLDRVVGRSSSSCAQDRLATDGERGFDTRPRDRQGAAAALCPALRGGVRAAGGRHGGRHHPGAPGEGGCDDRLLEGVLVVGALLFSIGLYIALSRTQRRRRAHGHRADAQLRQPQPDRLRALRQSRPVPSTARSLPCS